MNADDIISALDCCCDRRCGECVRLHSGHHGEWVCSHELMGLALALINRQKAEIDRLKTEMSYMKSPNTIGDTHEMGNMVMVAKYEPCSICEEYLRGVACTKDQCPVAKMKAENERLRKKNKQLKNSIKKFKERVYLRGLL